MKISHEATALDLTARHSFWKAKAILTCCQAQYQIFSCCCQAVLQRISEVKKLAKIASEHLMNSGFRP